MPNVIPPADERLNAAIAEYSGKTGINAASIAEVTRQIVGLLASRWEQLCEMAMDEGADGAVALSLGVKMDMSRRTPTGVVTLTFSQRTRDESTFDVPDPDQARLPFEERPTVVARTVPLRAPRPAAAVPTFSNEDDTTGAEAVADARTNQ